MTRNGLTNLSWRPITAVADAQLHFQKQEKS